MKGFKCLKYYLSRTSLLLSLFLSIIISATFVSQQSSALSFSDGGDTRPSACQATYGAGTVVTGSLQPYDNDCVISQSATYDRTINIRQLQMTLAKPIEANELINFKITFFIQGNPATTTNGLAPEFYGIIWENDNGFLILNQDCLDSSTYNGATSTPTNEVVTCTFTGLVTKRLSQLKTIESVIIQYKAVNDYIWNIYFGPITTRKLNYNGLTDDDRAWLESVLPDGTSTSDVEQGVSNALESQSEAERQELEGAQSDSQSDVDSAQDSVDSGTAPLVTQLSDLVNGLRALQPSNCVIPVDLFSSSMYGRGPFARSYNIDLCALPRPPSFDVIDRILLVVWYIAAVVVVLDAIISLFAEIQGGNKK